MADIEVYDESNALSVFQENDQVRGAKSARTLLEVLIKQGVLSVHIDTSRIDPRREYEDDDQYKARYDQEYNTLYQAQKEMVMMQAAAAGIQNFRAFIGVTLRDAFLSGRMFITREATESDGSSSPRAILQVVIDTCNLEWSLSRYALGLIRSFLEKLLPQFQARNLQIPDDFMATIIDDSAEKIRIPEKVRHAISVVSNEQARDGTVSDDTVQFVYDNLMDDTIPPIQFEREIRDRQGLHPLMRVDGECQVLADGKRRYVVVVDDRLGDALELKTKQLVEWRFQ